MRVTGSIKSDLCTLVAESAGTWKDGNPGGEEGEYVYEITAGDVM